MIVAAVPVKDLVNAKQRLVPVLDAPRRSALARAMLADVLRALAGAGLDRVWVVTREPEAAALARRFGAVPLAEAENRGHTAAVAAAPRGARGPAPGPPPGDWRTTARRTAATSRPAEPAPRRWCRAPSATA